MRSRQALVAFSILWLAGLLVTSSSAPAVAQAPAITTTSPLAIAPGSTSDIKVRGSNLAGATELWTSFGGNVTLAPDVKDNGKNAGEVVFRFQTASDLPVGIYGIRIATPKGVSPLKLIVVDDLPSVAATGKNIIPSAAQTLTLPVAVDGTIGSLAHNYYKFQAVAGQRLSFEVLARRLGSALDPFIRILDDRGREIAYSDDVPGLQADAQVCHTFEKAGQYTIEVRDIRYQGGGSHFYRLRIGDFPCVTVPYPMAVKRGTDATVSFAGFDIADVQPVKLKVPADSPLDWINVGAKRAGGTGSGFVALSVSSSDEAVEAEPNDELKQATRINPGASANGRFEKKGDIDHFIFAGKKGQRLTFTGITRSQGSPTSLNIRLLKADGAQVAAKDDLEVGNATFDYTIPADADYILALRDMNWRGGTPFAYRIAIQATQTGFTLAASADRLNIGAGGTAMVTVTSKRKGYNGPIQVSATDLPQGITSMPTVIGPGLNTVVLTVHSEPNSVTGKAIPIKIIGTARIGDTDFQAVASISGALKAAFNGLPYPPASLAESVAVGVSPKPQIRLRTEPAQIVFGRDLKAKVKVIVERDKGFDEAIALAVTPAKGGLPGGVTVAVKPIPKGKNEIEFEFTANNKAPMGEFTAVLTGTIKQGKQTVVQPVPGLGLSLRQPLALKVDSNSFKVAKGGQLKLRIVAERNPALKGAVKLSFQNLPAGVTAAAASIAADKNDIEVMLTVAKDAKPANVKNLVVKGEVTVGKTKYAANSPNITLVVE